MSNVKETLDETVGLYDKWTDRYKILYIKKKENENSRFEAGPYGCSTWSSSNPQRISVTAEIQFQGSPQ